MQHLANINSHWNVLWFCLSSVHFEADELIAFGADVVAAAATLGWKSVAVNVCM